MKTKTKLVFVLVMIATLIISLAVYKIQKDDFKDNFSNVELKQSKEFENDLNGILKSYLQSNDYVDKKDIPKCLSEVYDFCRSHTDVIKLYEYDSKNESVYIELKSGMTYLIIPPVEDRLSGKGSGEIVTFEPNKKSIQNFLAKSLMKIGGMEYRSVKDTAYFINEQCESFNFDSSWCIAIPQRWNSRNCYWGSLGRSYRISPKYDDNCHTHKRILTRIFISCLKNSSANNQPHPRQADHPFQKLN